MIKRADFPSVEDTSVDSRSSTLGGLGRPRNMSSNVFRAEDLRQPFEPWVHGWGLERFEPTDATPGSVAKVLVIAERLERGLPLWHPADPAAYRLDADVNIFAQEFGSSKGEQSTTLRKPVHSASESKSPIEATPLKISPLTRSTPVASHTPNRSAATQEQDSTAPAVVVSQQDDIRRMFQRTRDGVRKGLLHPTALDEFFDEHSDVLRSAGLTFEDTAPRPSSPTQVVVQAHQRPAASLFMPSDRPDISALTETLERLQRLVKSGAINASALDDFRSQYGGYIRHQAV